MSEGQTQRLYFHPRHLPTVQDGSKRITMRYSEPVHVGPALLVFELDDEVVIPGQILSAVQKAVRDVTDEEACEDGFGGARPVDDPRAEHDLWTTLVRSPTVRDGSGQGATIVCGPPPSARVRV